MRAGEQVAASLGAEPAIPGSLTTVETMIDQLAARAGIPMPALWVDQSTDPQATAAGESPYISVVIVSSGLLDRLESPELRAVLAHEIGHIALGHAADRTAEVLHRHGRLLVGAGIGIYGIGRLLSQAHPAFALAAMVGGVGMRAAGHKNVSDSFVHNRDMELAADAHACHQGLGAHLATGLIKMERSRMRHRERPAWASAMSFLGSIDTATHPPSRARVEAALHMPSMNDIRCWMCFEVRSSDSCDCGAGPAPAVACTCGAPLSPWDRYCGGCGTAAPEGACLRCGTIPATRGAWCTGCGGPRP